ncbi:N-acetylglucosamine kinase [Deinococcus sp.]|uniref:N-acetylglucosamine kinase n=1 Tax=Deinococcus sp. TaxID=47478 RepID=UPI003C7B79C1
MASDELLLGIDAGGSSTKWALFGLAGEVVLQGRLEALTGHLFTPGDEEHLRALLSRLAEETGTGAGGLGSAGPAAVVMGVSGLQVDAAPLFLRALADTFGLPTVRIRVINDLELAHAAHFAPGEGVLVYAGTGSMAYFEGTGGEVVRAGGHGFLLGDEGGAFWQGQQGLKALLALQDAAGPLTGPLAQGLAAVIGSLDWPQVRAWVYGGGRAALATLAPAVEQAAQAGDPLAQDVLERAGEALAGLAHTVLNGLGDSRPALALAGGAASAPVRAAFLEALRQTWPEVQLVPPRAPVLGAPRLSPLASLRPPDRAPSTQAPAP